MQASCEIPPQSSPSLERKLLTLQEASEETKISVRKLQMDMAAGSIAYIKIGRLTRFLPSDVHDYILSRRVPSRKEVMFSPGSNN